MSRQRIFDTIEAPGTAELVEAQIKDLIRQGVLRPGSRLPAERDLARQMQVSRPTVRQALKELESLGLIHTNYGGGTFVTNALGSQLVDPLVTLLDDSPESYLDFLEFRSELEGAAAELAARHATRHDIEILNTIFAEMMRAHADKHGDREAQLDIQFHTAIIEASHNVVFATIARALYGVLWRGISDSRKQVCVRSDVDKALVEQHRRIRDAIVSGAPPLARRCMVDHLRFVREAVEAEAGTKRRESAAARRLEVLREELGSVLDSDSLSDRSD